MQFLGLKQIRADEKDKDYHRYWYELNAEGYNALRISYYYNKGGYSGMDWTYKERGYYCAISPVTLTQREYGWSEESSLYGKNSGGFVIIEPTTRFNKKRFDELKNRVEETLEPYAVNLLHNIGADTKTPVLA